MICAELIYVMYIKKRQRSYELFSSNSPQLIKQAALVGGLLFGSRAFTETILVVGSSNGGDHVVAAIAQAAIALVCAGYFFFK